MHFQFYSTASIPSFITILFPVRFFFFFEVRLIYLRLACAVVHKVFRFHFSIFSIHVNAVHFCFLLSAEPDPAIRKTFVQHTSCVRGKLKIHNFWHTFFCPIRMNALFGSVSIVLFLYVQCAHFLFFFFNFYFVALVFCFRVKSFCETCEEMTQPSDGINKRVQPTCTHSDDVVCILHICAQNASECRFTFL